MFCAVKSNSPLSAPRDDTARASCGMGRTAISCQCAKAYHKLGLTARQAGELSTWQDTLKAAQEQRVKDESEAQRVQQLAAVRKEWGGEFNENLRLGKRAVREFGLKGSVEKLETALGSGELLKLTAKLGHGLKEDAFAGGTAGRSFGKTKEEAA